MSWLLKGVKSGFVSPVSSNTARSGNISHVNVIVGSSVEQVGEDHKNGNFLHWNNVPQREYVIKKPLPNKGFQWVSR